MRLLIDGVVAGYGRMEVLHGLSIAAEGARVGLFGPNGHGKTTLLRTLSGLIRPKAGSIRFEDREIGCASPGAIVGLGLIHVPQGSTLFPRMSVLEALTL